jgi:hypothetical protein
MRSPRKVCSSGSSHTAHSLPTNVLSRRVRLLSVSNIPAMPPPARFWCSLDPLLSLDCRDFTDGDDSPDFPRDEATARLSSVEREVS